MSPPAESAPYLVLGAGLAGLAAAAELGGRAVTVEAAARPGGLVRTERRGRFWFDHVLHILYFGDAATERFVRALEGHHLAPCPPDARVHSMSGSTRYPVQMHLAGLPLDTTVACLEGLAHAAHHRPATPPASFEEMLRASFGEALCAEFFFPYNEKVWRRPLASLAPSGFQWNIATPDLGEALRGALARDPGYRAYNADGHYPRPPRDAPLRGMELLSQALARSAADLRLEHRVSRVDVDERRAWMDTPRGERSVGWERACIATLPLPELIAACPQAPPELVARCARLRRNRVRSVMLSVIGPRPERPGHWHYHADPALCFTRVIHLTEFDPGLAPPEGFALLVEITERAEDPPRDDDELIAAVRADLEALGALGSGCEVVDAAVRSVDPAYVVFDLESPAIVRDALAFLRAHGVHPVGRYGRWEYSSMAHVIRDGRAVAGLAQGAVGSSSGA